MLRDPFGDARDLQTTAITGTNGEHRLLKLAAHSGTRRDKRMRASSITDGGRSVLDGYAINIAEF
jgi:hypothetical protein